MFNCWLVNIVIDFFQFEVLKIQTVNRITLAFCHELGHFGL